MATLPLDGFVIGVTADRRAQEQCDMLRRRGARVMHGAAMQTVTLESETAIHAATEHLLAHPPAVLVVNTGVGVRNWFAAAESWGLGDELINALAQARILARGPKAAGAVITAGLTVAWRAPSAKLEEAVDEILEHAPAGAHVAIQLDGNVEQKEAERLRAHGFAVTELRIYEWAQPADPEPAVKLLNAVCDRRVDAVTFTSAAALESFHSLAERQGRVDDLRVALNGPVIAACVGPVCAEAARHLGLQGRHPERHRLGAMVHWLTAELESRKRRVRLAGTDVEIQGAAATIDGERVTLTERERSVLDVLLAKRGAVVSRAELLRTVWDSNADEHALEVTITRLRRRLGPAGSAVRTVVRRGYRLDLE